MASTEQTPIPAPEDYKTIRLTGELREQLLEYAAARLYTAEEEAEEHRAHAAVLARFRELIADKASPEEMTVLVKFKAVTLITGIQDSREGRRTFCFCPRDPRQPPYKGRRSCHNRPDSDAVKACGILYPGGNGCYPTDAFEPPTAEIEALRPHLRAYFKAEDATDEARKKLLASIQAVIAGKRTLQEVAAVFPEAMRLAEKMNATRNARDTDEAAVAAAFKPGAA